MQIIFEIKQLWRNSKAYRILLAVTVVYAVLRLVVHGAYLAVMLFPQAEIMGGMPGWVEAEGPMIPNDLQDYLNGATLLKNREDLYLKGPLDRVEFYQYSPSYALAFTVFLYFSPLIVVVIHTMLHFVCYGLLYIKWRQIFGQLGLKSAAQMLIWVLPVWLLFSAFWADLSYLNIYIIMALLGTLLIDAVINERLGQSVLWASIILQVKPQWVFAIAVPLFLGRYRFFLRLFILTCVASIGIVGVTLLLVGPEYGWQQYVNYVQFLSNMPGNFPWRGPESPFLGYNHSVKQIVVYLFGVSSGNLLLADVIKVLLLVPLGIVGVRHLLKPLCRAGRDVPVAGLDWAFALYLGAFIWLDMVWELSLGIALYPYLLGTIESRSAKLWVHIAFLPYALLDLWQVGSLIFGGMDIILPGAYVATDPSIYVPLIIAMILMLYALLVARLRRPVLEPRVAGV
ncbi:MAG: hypothetical protein ACP5J4_12140 [Anaerolineae bacterium]